MNSYRVVWPCHGVAELEAFEVPALSAGQVLLRSHVTLISPGTERAFYLGLPNAVSTFPIYPGYSCAGHIEQSASEEHSTGQRVVCQSAHAAHSVIRAEDCIPIPDGLADEDAVFFSLLAVALQGVRKAHIELGEAVVVIGAGIVGLLAALLAQQNGGIPIVLVDKDEKRLEFARGLGFDVALSTDDNIATVLQDLCGEKGAAVVIEATGFPQAIVQAFSLAGRDARVVLLGTTRGEVDNVDFCFNVHKKGLTILGAHNSTRPKHESAPGRWLLKEDQRVVLKLMAAGRFIAQPLLTHCLPWQRALEAYDLLTQSDGSIQGILLDWRTV